MTTPIWTPQPGPQTYALESECDELLYGGARGGGKSSYLLGDFAQQVGLYGGDARGILFRRTYKQLDEIVYQGQEIYVRSGVAVWQKADMQFLFTGSGATLRLRHLGRLEDCDEYQGQAASWQGYDEAGGFTSFAIFERMRACARTKIPWVKPVLRYTANPGGRLHNELKRYFVDPAPKGYRVITNEAGKTRVYVPARVQDNAILMQADPGYMRYLQSITNEALRKAWCDGCWDVAIGSFFGEVWDREKHVIRHIDLRRIPKNWEIYRSFDWGSAKPYGVLWWTVAANDIEIDGMTYPQGAIIVLRELYGARKDEIDTGLGEGSATTALKILAMEREFGHDVRPGPADPALWQVKDGPSTAGIMSHAGVSFVRADNSRVAGWEQVRTRFVGNDHGAMLYICEDCTNLIRTLPVLVRDEKRWEDLDSSQEDHLCDVLRYLCLSHPMTPLTASQLRILEERKRRPMQAMDPRFGGVATEPVPEAIIDRLRPDMDEETARKVDVVMKDQEAKHRASPRYSKGG